MKQLFERYRKGTAESVRALGKVIVSGLSLEDKWIKEYSRPIPIWFQGVWIQLELWVSLFPVSRKSVVKISLSWKRTCGSTIRMHTMH